MCLFLFFFFSIRIIIDTFVSVISALLCPCWQIRKCFKQGQLVRGWAMAGPLIVTNEWQCVAHLLSFFFFFVGGALHTYVYMYIHIQGSVAPVTPTPLPFFFIFFYYDITPPCYSTRVFCSSFLGVLHEPVDGMCDARKIYTPHSFCTSICLFMYLILFFEIRFSSIIRIHSICYYFLFYY